MTDRPDIGPESWFAGGLSILFLCDVFAVISSASAEILPWFPWFWVIAGTAAAVFGMIGDYVRARKQARAEAKS